MQQIAYDLLPSSFDADDPKLRAIRVPHDWRWTSCEAALKEFGSCGVMSRLPLFWQVTPSLHRACRSVGIPLFSNDVANMPLGAAVISAAGIDTVIAETRDAVAFSIFLKERKLRFPKAWILVHRINDSWDVPEPLVSGAIAQEVHLSPGVVFLWQCRELIHRKATSFHIWKSPEPELPGNTATRVEKIGACACGRAIVNRQP